LLIASLAAFGAFAMGFGGKGARGHFGNNGVLKEALESGDYNAYIKAIEASNMTCKMDNITEEKFNNLVNIVSKILII